MKKIIIMSVVLAVTGISMATVLISEDFDNISEWTLTDDSTQVSTVANGGRLVTGPIDDSGIAVGEVALISQGYDNSVSQYSGYKVSFEMNFTSLDFEPTGIGNNTIEVFSMINAGNSSLTKLTLSARDYNDDYVFAAQNAIQYGTIGTAWGSRSFSITELEGYSRMGIENVTSFNHVAGLHWIVTTDWTFTDLTDSSEVLSFTTAVDGNSANASFNPLTGTTKFKLGEAYTQHQYSDDRWTGSYSFDDFEVSNIPEPATIGMLGLGALVAMLSRRMRG